mmetsp:Transcript_18689/g.35059  ORF Transcript_18689/g.35059 Transcript_18689/m.35059 type:complete len:125 (+) Transcript_18689:21-395(+)
MMGAIAWVSRLHSLDGVVEATADSLPKEFLQHHWHKPLGLQVAPKLSKELLQRLSVPQKETVRDECLSLEKEASPTSPANLSDCSACNIPTHRFERGSSIDSIESLLSTTSSEDYMADRCFFPE